MNQLRHHLTPGVVLFLGTVQVLRVYRGNTLVWSAFTFSHRWKRDAYCRGLPAETFVPKRLNPKPPKVVTSLCPVCPVRLKCESYGRASGSTGWWGGVLLHLGQPVLGSSKRRPSATKVLTTVQPLTKRKITIEQANEIRERWKARGVTQVALAAEFGVDVTHIHNIIHGKALKIRRAKLTDDDVAEIRRRYAAGGVFQKELAAEFGVTTQRISELIGQGLGSRSAAKTHCPRGHEYTAENTEVWSNKRSCRQCRRDRESRR